MAGAQNNEPRICSVESLHYAGTTGTLSLRSSAMNRGPNFSFRID
jgi:hypothetical protein